MNAIVGIFRIVHVPCKNIHTISDRNRQVIIDKIDQQHLVAMMTVPLIGHL